MSPLARKSLEGFYFEVLFDEVPVDHVPEPFHILRASIPVIDVIGMLPNIARQEWDFSARHGISGVTEVLKGKRAILVFHKPCPAGAEERRGRCAEFLLEGRESPERLVDFAADAPVGSFELFGVRQFQ